MTQFVSFPKTRVESLFHLDTPELSQEQLAHVKDLVQVLRSNEYTQVHFNLHVPDTNKFCILGVACAVYAKTQHTPISTVLGWYQSRKIPSNYLPKEVGDYFGFVNQSCMGCPFAFIKTPVMTGVLSVLNDDYGLIFEDFASLFETALLKVTNNAKRTTKETPTKKRTVRKSKKMG